MGKLAAIGFLIVGSWLAMAGLPFILDRSGHPIELEKLSQWGEIFGSLSALYAAVGFFAVIWTLREQRIENHKQQFDRSYFELLRFLREARDDFRFRFSEPYAEAYDLPDRRLKYGTSAFRTAWDEAEHWIESDRKRTHASIAKIYDKHIHNRFESNLGPYFRLMYTMLYRIDTDRILLPYEKIRYANLLRSQVNSYELAVAALNGLSPVSKDFKMLITKFHFLKYMPHGFRRSVFESLYAPEAFAARSDSDDNDG